MIRLTLLSVVLAIHCLQSWGQCVVSQDEHKQIITRYESYDFNSATAAAHRAQTYLGNQYLTFPIWQNGTIRIDQGGKEISCEIAYDLIRNEVMCRFDGGSTASHIIPYEFTILGIKFIRQLNSRLGIDYQLYSTLLYDGRFVDGERSG